MYENTNDYFSSCSDEFLSQKGFALIKKTLTNSFSSQNNFARYVLIETEIILYWNRTAVVY